MARSLPGRAILLRHTLEADKRSPPVLCAVDGLILLAWSVACQSKSGVLSDRRVSSE